MNSLILVLVLAATIAIFATTRSGREIAKRIGFRDRVKGAASTEDVDFLLSACDGNRASVGERLRFEQERFPELTEAEHYRRAIRRVMAERASSESGTR